MSSTNVKFATNFSAVRKPGVYLEYNLTEGIRALSGLPDKIIVLAQRTSSGSVPVIATRNYTVPQACFSAADAALYFGNGSIAHLTAKALLEQASNAGTQVDLYVMGINDAGGAATATGAIEFDEPADAGVAHVWVGDQHVETAYAATDDSWDIASGITAAMQEIANDLPVTWTATGPTGSTGAKITFTAKNGGYVGNYIPLSVKCTSAMTNIITDMTGGATDPTIGPAASGGTPDLTKALGYIYSSAYTVIVNTFAGATGPTAATQIDHCVSFCDEVSSSTEQRPCIQVIAQTDLINTQADFVTLCGTDLNHWRTTGAYLRYANDDLAKSEYFKIAGAYAADLVRYEQQSVPYDDDVLNVIAPPAEGDRPSRAQQENMIGNGVASLYVVPGENVAVVRAVTTYTKNTSGSIDRSLIDINTPRTLDRVRYEIKYRLQTVFTGTNRVATANKPKEVVSQVKDVLYILEGQDIVKNVRTYESQIIAEYDDTDPTQLNVYIPTPIVPGLHKICGKMVLIQI